MNKYTFKFVVRYRKSNHNGSVIIDFNNFNDRVSKQTW